MSRTILVVDDVEPVREMLGEMLREAGYAVVEAEQGKRALERLHSHRVDLIVSDIAMPVMDGYALYERVRGNPEWASLPFIFLTAHGERPRVRQAKELGVDDYLIKPVSSEDLLVAVRALLERHARLLSARDAQIDKVKEAILTAVAHELRTPLTLVSGYAELLAESSTEEANRLRALVDGVLKGTRRLQRLAEDLVFLVELRSGEAQRRFAASRGPVLLSALLRDAGAARRDDAASRAIVLHVDVPDALPPVLGEARLLSEAVDRLLDNALRFSKASGGAVVLRAGVRDGCVVVEVEDQGVGIPPDQLQHVCELFQQVDRARIEQQGVGCGLTVARSIVLMHGGELGARSEPGVGSTFTLSLPSLR